VTTGPHLLVSYDYVEDILERRGPFRDEHLARLVAGKEAGWIIAAGALGDPPTGAAIAIAGDDESQAQALIDGDPYVLNGLVTAWRIVPWSVVV
jgi:uncharacterized protein